MSLPVSFDGERPRIVSRAPRLGEHNPSILGVEADAEGAAARSPSEGALPVAKDGARHSGAAGANAAGSGAAGSGSGAAQERRRRS
jgi:hypothetical protein